MGANSTQAVGIVILLAGFTVLAGAFAGGGVLLGVLALALLAGAAFVFLKCRPLEYRE